jgi:fatty acid desaturase
MPEAARRLLNDPRDLPFLPVTLAASLMIPLAAYLFLPGRFDWWLGAGYLLLASFLFLDRMILIIHFTSHRPLFRNPWLNRYIPWVLAPFFGVTPETYFGHHIGMHHPEKNGGDDLSSTERLRRDHAGDFARYFLRFLFLGLIELVCYLWRKGRRRLATRVVVGELAFLAGAAGLLAVEWRAAIVVFWFPLVAVRFVMMAGNWGQHAFVDPRRAASSYGNSVTCINTRYNRRCFNDGYHIGHHLHPTRHWSELPDDFRENLDRYAAEGAVVFEGIDFFQIWFLLMLRRYDRLARHWVALDGVARSRDEITALLRARTAPISVARRAPRRSRRLPPLPAR